MLTKAQRSQRSEAIYGSDMADILMSTTTRSLVVAEKAHLLKPKDYSGNLAIESGNRLESALGKWSEDVFGAAVSRTQKTYVCPTLNILRGHFDGIFRDDNVGLEIKVVGPGMAGEWGPSQTQEIPLRVYIQCQTYMVISGFQRWRIFALINSTDPRTYELAQDENAAEIITVEAKRAWFDVERARREHYNPLDDLDFSSAAAQDAVSRMNERIGIDDSEPVILDPYFSELLETRAHYSKLKTEADNKLKAINAELIAAMKGASRAVCPGAFEVSRKKISVKPRDAYEYIRTTVKAIETKTD